ncbi:MAG: diaminopimelate decarboxylase [Epsilonproteobacteria bacterium]|jgi:diaminopimelate decarboxylase|uniref:Diaminopimelate decarboxylase n=1 Tax=Sulfurospirillum cavolei TaxID=366522 RepID=A0A2D3W3R7_9BACT|nr:MULTISPECIES: diaminopimelate decarboxylase [unclassified Sulfurospirillum]MCD8544508.1 diaminopimelate decarboxylase [Sulfurospirillum cavolei]NCB54860.1 diaminopimelate decarboxylase [Campylobacterota bacterium]KHG34775.1 MAG: diaminopimelate decarboxylase [Sulfurospirillum sp. MES]MCP3652307.1 diaminopimelate decarboxylase [Sulfurospirillum sp. DNRA8]MCR1811157.1 diaminopimelate decarboxylase [Sulfurospirillum sp. DNRA8]
MTKFSALAQQYGTPLYVYDFDVISQKFLALKEVFKARKSLICFALKANSNLSVLKHMADLGAGCDCVSIGEVKRALKAGVPKYKIIFSGVGKRDDEIEEALKSDILMLNLESEEEMKRVETIASNLGVVARISIRVNPNIDPKTHPYISTGLHENKFGVDVESAKRMYLYAKNVSSLDPVGIHFHIGSQITDVTPFKEAAVVLANLVRSLKALNVDIKFFDVGGGIGIRYNDEETIALYDYAQAIFSAMSGLDVTLVCEPGRYLVGDCGFFLTRVLYEKQNGHKRFVIIDGAMNDLIRPSLYQAYHEIEAEGKSKEHTSLCDVVGPICESGDFFAKNIALPPLEHDDLLIVKSAGAYGFAMSSNYNSRARVAEVALEQGEGRLIRRRESFEDMIALEEAYM